MELKRALLFLVGCMGARLSLTYAAYRFPELLPWLGLFAACVSAGFTLIYVNGWRKTGVETGGQAIWWNNLRPVHAILYGLFAVLALKGVKKHAWKVLLLDTLIGFLAFMSNHFS